MRAHGVYSFGMVNSSALYNVQGEFSGTEGYAESDKIQHRAAAVAALVCMRFPGVLNAPTYEAVIGFMRAAKA